MTALVHNLQIVINGKFEPLYVQKVDINELIRICSSFLLFPKEITERRIQFSSHDTEQITTVTKSFELVSANQKTSLRIRPEIIAYNYENSEEESFENIIDNFLNVLESVKNLINFELGTRLGAIFSCATDTEACQIPEILDAQIIEYSKRIVTRKNLDAITEVVNFVKSTNYTAEESGHLGTMVNISYDINTLFDKDTARFSIKDVNAFLVAANQLMKQEEIR